jgi:hypothetical protein
MKKLLFFALLLLAIASDVSAISGCTYYLVNISMLKTATGIALQIVSSIFLFHDLVRSNKGKPIIASDYLRYGFLRTKWYYFSMILLFGTMLFAEGLNHPYLSGAFQPGESWWSCPKN